MPLEKPTLPPGPSRRTLSLIGLVLLLVGLSVVVSGVLSRRSQAARLAERADAQAVRSVVVISPVAAGDAGALQLPGRIEAWSRAPIYARVSGYLKSWSADIGTRVKAGQVLAEIETPDLDQQLLQAQAELSTAKANTALSETTAKRWQELLDSGMVTRQGVEEKTSDLAAKQSVMRAMQANVERLHDLQSFEKVVAPFSGVVTSRSTDVGALINAGSGQGAELFRIADLHRVWILADLPAADVQYVRPGMMARLHMAGRPVPIEARVSRDVLPQFDSTTQSMKIRLEAANPDFLLRPEMFVDVDLEVTYPPSILVPAESIMMSGLRSTVFVERAAGVFEPREVELGRQFGGRVAIERGLEPFERVVVSGTFLLDSESRMKSHDQPHH